MTRQDFDDLVRRLEARYHGRPNALERSATAWVALGRTAVLSWLGAIFLAGTVAFVVGATAGTGPGVLLLGVGVALFVYGFAQAGLVLLVDLAPPDGRVLKPGEAPALGAMLGVLRAELRCRPFDEVRTSMDFNAGVREVPRLGLFGWPRTILEIGLPLLMTLTPEEMRAVLAHEFAHISARHARGGSRLYRLQRTWNNVFEQMQRPASGRAGRATRWAVSRFIDWYWPRLHARTLILSRAQEFQADRIAAGIAGAPAVASALWRIECVGPRLQERFWPDLHGEAIRLPEPPADLFDRLRAEIESAPSPADASLWTERGMARATGNDNTHPAFPDRVRSLGGSPDEHCANGYPPAPRPSAAEELLGADRDPIEGELSAQWRRASAAAWRERHRRAAAEARRRPTPVVPNADAPESAPADALTLWQAAREAAESLGTAPAEPLLRAVLGRDPDHPGASVVLGHHLLSRGDDEGERLLQRVAGQGDEEWMPRACAVLHDYYRASGQADRLREMRGRLDRHEADLAAARRERSAIGPRDAFSSHGLADPQIEPLRTLLASLPDCEAAWLVRKDVRHFPNRPVLVLCVRAKSTRWGLDRSERDQELVKWLVPRVELPGQSLVIARHGGFRKLAAKIMAMPGSEVFRRVRAEAPSSPSGAR